MKARWIILAAALICAVSASAVEVTLTDSNMRLQVYGYIRADIAHDTQTTVPGDLAFFVVPRVDGERSGKTHFTARETRFGLALFGPDTENWKTSGRLELDFYGGGGDNTYTPRIRLAFMDFAHTSGFALRVGQDWETFIEVIPRIVNFSYLANAGALGLRRPQVRATQEVKLTDDTKLVLRAAIARTIGQDLDGGGYDDGADAEWPTAQWNIALHQKLWTEKAARIAFSGHYGRETLDETNEDGRIIAVDVVDYDTWSAQGSLFLPLTDKIAFQGNIWVGENLDTYFGGIMQGVNLGKETAIKAKGGWAQILWDPTDKVCFALGYSVDNPDNDDLNPGMRSKNEITLVNGTYRLTQAVSVMAEYSHITTHYLERDSTSSDRVQLAMRYAF